MYRTVNRLFQLLAFLGLSASVCKAGLAQSYYVAQTGQLTALAAASGVPEQYFDDPATSPLVQTYYSNSLTASVTGTNGSAGYGSTTETASMGKLQTDSMATASNATNYTAAGQTALGGIVFYDTLTVTSSTLPYGTKVTLLGTLNVSGSALGSPGSSADPTPTSAQITALFSGVGTNLEYSNTFSSNSNGSTSTVTASVLTSTFSEFVGEPFTITGVLGQQADASAGGTGGSYYATADATANFYVDPVTPGISYTTASGARYLSSVPEPGTFGLMVGCGVVGVGLLRRRFRKHAKGRCSLTNSLHRHFLPLCAGLVFCTLSPAQAGQTQNLYVANRAPGKIVEITPDGDTSTFIDGLSEPEGVAFDSSGNLYVANDATHSILKITPSGVQTTFASGDLFGGANGLAFDSAGNLYVADSLGYILKITPGGVVSTFAGEFGEFFGLAFDRNGNLFAAGGYENSIMEFTPDGDGSIFTTFDSGLYNPIGLAFDAAGNLYSGSSFNVMKITPGGTQSIFAGGLAGVVGLAFDSDGNLYAADSGSQQNGNSIIEITPSGVELTFATGFDVAQYLAFAPADTPEPGVIGLLASAGVVGIGLLRRRRRKNTKRLSNPFEAGESGSRPSLETDRRE